jgi:Insulin-induced protein (INSIG)
VLWYVIDGSATGLMLSMIASTCGAAALVGCGPEIVSWTGETVFGNATTYGGGSGSGSVGGLDAAFSSAGSTKPLQWPWGYEGFAVWMWVASALFYGVVCFGNIGRMLSGTRSWR